MKWRRGEKRSEKKARENKGGASLLFREDLVYVVPQRLTRDGWRVYARPIVEMPASAPLEALGVAALEAIESSRGVIDTPSDPSGLGRDLVGELGFPSLAAFQRGAKFVSLHEGDDGQIGVAPSKGTNQGFTFRKPRFSPPSPGELGAAILDAMALSEASPPLKNSGSGGVASRGRRKGGEPDPRDEQDQPVAFGSKMSWLAVRATDPRAVAGALGLRDVTAMPWAEGIGGAYEDSIFVTPPMSGWVLVVGASLPSFEEAAWRDRLVQLSKTLGEAQGFATNRVSEYHAWLRAQGGRLIRAFAYSGEAGEVLLDLGTPTSEERDRDPKEPDDSAPAGPDPDEDTVFGLAGRWSIDPTTLGSEEPSKGSGWSGAMPST